MKPFIIAAILGISLTLSGCTQPDRSFFTLQDQGYTEIKIGGYAWFMCSEDDNFATRFTAVSPSGTKVSGAVCSAFFKGATIRFD